MELITADEMRAKATDPMTTDEIANFVTRVNIILCNPSVLSSRSASFMGCDRQHLGEYVSLLNSAGYAVVGVTQGSYIIGGYTITVTW